MKPFYLVIKKTYDGSTYWHTEITAKEADNIMKRYDKNNSSTPTKKEGGS